jgi:hypothetical protein
MNEYEIIMDIKDDTPETTLDNIVDDINDQIKNKYEEYIGKVYWYKI